MSKRSKILVLLMLVAMLCMLSVGCDLAVSVTEISVVGEYQTAYFIGDDLSITGMNLLVTYSSGVETTVSVADVMQDVIFYDFNTTNASDDLAVTIKYKGVSATFNVSVASQDYSNQYCTVAFETNGGSTIDPIDVNLYSKIDIPTEPTKDDYGFVSWYEDSTLSNEWNFTVDTVQDDMTLYAKWLPLVTITFYTNPEGSANNSVYETRTVTEGGTLSSRPTVPSVEGSTGSWDRNSWSDLTTDISVYPTYTVNTYTITFYDNGTGENLSMLQFTNVYYGTYLLDPAGDYYAGIMAIESSLTANSNKENYYFDGWVMNGATVDLKEKVTGNITAYTNYARNSFNVTYLWNTDLIDDVTYETQEGVYYGSHLTEPTEPPLDGYVFMGWYTNADTTTAWDFTNDTLTGTQTLYAMWAEAFTVIFYQVKTEDYHNETDITCKKYLTYTVTSGDSLSTPTVPSVTGYTGKWDIVSLDNITSNLEIYPIYTINTYTVKFAVEGEVISEQTIAYMSDAVAPQDSEVVVGYGYEFDSWEGTYTGITENTTINAKIKEIEYTITYISNADTSYGYEYYKQTISLPTPERDSYEFGGWYFEESSETLCTTDYVITGDVTLYAKWTEIYTITINYYATEDDYNDSTQSKKIVYVTRGNYFDESDLPVTYAAAGKDIAWYGVADIDSNEIFSSSNPVNFDYTLNAIYSDALYTITFVYSDNTTSDYTLQYNYNVVIIPPKEAPELEGNTFAGWKKDGDSTITDFSTTTVYATESTTYYAQYTLDTYKVEFIILADENSGYDMDIDADEVISEQTVTHGNSASTPATSLTSVHDGYSFSGWKIKDAEGAFITADFTSVTADMTIYASYAKNTYTITYISDDRSIIYYELEYVEYNTILTQSLYTATYPTKTGYTFKGWDYTGTGESVTSDTDKVTLTSNLEVYAVFEINTYTITFSTDASNSSSTDAMSIKYLNSATEPTDPTWTNNSNPKSFLGWYIDENYTAKYVFSTPITDSITLYAKWDTITYASGATFTYQVSEDETYIYISGVTLTANNVVVPNYASANGSDLLPVIGIGSAAFANLSTMLTIYLPDTLQFINQGAFSGCSSLKSIGAIIDNTQYNNVMPNSLNSIGQNAFENCTSLTSITFGELSELTTIGANAFSMNTSLVEFELPNSSYDITIGDAAFWGCSSLLLFDFGTNVTSIGANAFKNCSSLRYVTFYRNSKTPSLSDTSFSGVSNSFRIYVINSSLYEASDLNSAGWTTYESIVIDMSYITADGEWAYTTNSTGIELVHYLGEDTTATVPTSIDSKTVTTLGDYVFDKYVTEIIFSTGSISLTSLSLAAASGLTAISVEGTDSYNTNLMTYIKDVFEIATKLNSFSFAITSNNTTLSALFGGSVPSGLTTVEILEGTYLPDNMFYNCRLLTTVILPAVSSFTIGEYAFYGCTNLTTVMFKDGDTTVEVGGADRSISVTIGAYAFSGATSLKLYADEEGLQIFEATVASIGAYALTNTPALASLYESATDGFITVGTILYAYNSSASDASDVVTIPSTITIINDYAFYNDSGIRAIVSTGTDALLITIGANAFSGCYNLETVMLPSSLATIGSGAFDGCSKLVKVIMQSASEPKYTAGIFDDAMTSLELYVNNSNSSNFAALAKETGNAAITANSFGVKDDFIVAAVDNQSINTILYYIGASQSVDISDDDYTYDYTSVANYAFSRFSEIDNSSDTASTYITSISFDSSATVLSENSFTFLTKLTSITLTNTANILANNTKYLYNLITNNANLTTLVIDGANTLSNIVGGKSLTDSSITTINLSSASTLVSYLLYNQTSIKSVVLPTSVLYSNLGIDVFTGTQWADTVANDKKNDHFVTITVDGSSKAIVYYNGTDAVVTLPKTVTHIASGVFQNNTYIEMVIFGASITYIGDYAFNGAAQLSKVVITEYSGYPIEVGTDAFKGTATGIETIKVSGSITTVTKDTAIIETLYIDGNYYFTINSDKETATLQFVDNVVDITVPKSVSYNGTDYTVSIVGNNAFTNKATSLTITLDYELSEYAIENLKNITELTLLFGKAASSDEAIDFESEYTTEYTTMFDSFGDNNTALKYITFDGGFALDTLFAGGLTSVTEVTIVEGTENLVNYLLRSFTNVSTITIPTTIATLGYYMFEQTAWYAAQSNNGSYIVMSNGWLYKYTGSESKPVIPATVTVISSYAFATYSAESETWQGNTKITIVSFATESQLTTIMANAFYGAANLISLNLPTSATTFEEDAFNNCGAVYTETTTDNEGKIISTMTYVKSDANEYTLLTYATTATTVTIPTGVTVIADYAFSGNTSITEIVFNEGLIAIGAYAFSGCTNLATVTLQSTITEIGAFAFNDTYWYKNTAADYIIMNGRLVLYTGDATSLTYNQPDVTSIANGAFASSSVTEITIEDYNASILTSDAYCTSLINMEAIYVAEGNVNTFKDAWVSCKDIIKEIEVDASTDTDGTDSTETDSDNEDNIVA